MTLPDRFYTKIEIPDGPLGCWLWAGAKSKDGYGHFRVGGRRGRTVIAHRLAYEELIGPIPIGLEIDHLCRVRRCVNPSHLEAVSHRVNVDRGDYAHMANRGANNARKTHCPLGHPYDERNTLLERRGDRVVRRCRHCRGVQKGYIAA